MAKSVTISLEEKTILKIDKLAKDDRRTRSKMIEVILERYIGEKNA